MKSSKQTVFLVIAAACCLLCRVESAASVRVSITIASSMDEVEEDGPAWVDTPPTARHEALLARALGDQSNYLATVQRPICLLNAFALKTQRVDARHVNYLFQANGCVVATHSSGGFCRDRSCRLIPFEVQVHAEAPSSSAQASKLVVEAIRYLD